MTTARTRQLLGRKVEGFSDREVQDFINLHFPLAEALLELVLRKLVKDDKVRSTEGK